MSRSVHTGNIASLKQEKLRLSLCKFSSRHFPRTQSLISLISWDLSRNKIFLEFGLNNNSAIARIPNIMRKHFLKCENILLFSHIGNFSNILYLRCTWRRLVWTRIKYYTKQSLPCFQLWLDKVYITTSIVILIFWLKQILKDPANTGFSYTFPSRFIQLLTF